VVLELAAVALVDKVMMGDILLGVAVIPAAAVEVLQQQVATTVLEMVLAVLVHSG